MKLSSKSIFSPSHISREPPPPSQMPLSSSSFNKRLLTNGQASPMFTTVSVESKRGSGFDKPEPSSPKVTCNGQVRVKAKRRGARSKSKRISGARFRIAEVGMNQNLHQQQQDRNQKWVHLPLIICEALKELSCMFPCIREKEEKVEDAGRWMVTMQEGKKEIELVMGEEEEEDRTRHRRKHVFEDIDLDDIEKVKNKKEREEEEEEEEERGSVSICIPPKNALLLMRCRSDPVKVAALTNRFLQPNISKGDDEEVPMEEDPMEEDKEEVHESENGIDRVDNEKGELTNQVETNEEEEEEHKADEDENGNEQVETISENDVKGEEEEEGSKERENKSNIERGSGSLPECLLMMMCEPKLSIEVSKETWVCTADFVRWLPPRPAVKTVAGDHRAKKRIAVESKSPMEPPPLPVIKPGRSSCSFPAPVRAPNVCESDVLKRCKSEPRESAAAKLAPEGCLRNNRKLMEPYSSARLGFGAAGVGF
ncbi:hypothetical protein Lal_00034979 [Lupinus albus]|nr:hypothetical protein Lal_00034979 [Lupinus albus]